MAAAVCGTAVSPAAIELIKIKRILDLKRGPKIDKINKWLKTTMDLKFLS